MWKWRCVTGESPSETSRQQQHTRRAFTFDSGRLHCDGDFHSLAYPPSTFVPIRFLFFFLTSWNIILQRNKEREHCSVALL
jgi:hypothetical protein